MAAAAPRRRISARWQPGRGRWRQINPLTLYFPASCSLTGRLMMEQCNMHAVAKTTNDPLCAWARLSIALVLSVKYGGLLSWHRRCGRQWPIGLPHCSMQKGSAEVKSMICMGIFLSSRCVCKQAKTQGVVDWGFWSYSGAQEKSGWKVGKSPIKLKKTALQRDCQQQRTKTGAARLARWRPRSVPEVRQGRVSPPEQSVGGAQGNTLLGKRGLDRIKMAGRCPATPIPLPCGSRGLPNLAAEYIRHPAKPLLARAHGRSH